MGRIRITRLEGEMDASLTRRARPAMCAQVCCSQVTGYVIDTAMGETPRRYAACPHEHSHFTTFHESVCHNLSLSAEHVCLSAASLECIQSKLQTSTQAQQTG